MSFDIFKFKEEELKNVVITRRPQLGLTLAKVWNPTKPKRVKEFWGSKYLVFDCKFDYFEGEKLDKSCQHELEIPTKACVGKWVSEVEKFNLQEENLVNVVILKESNWEYFVMMLDWETYDLAVTMAKYKPHKLKKLIKEPPKNGGLQEEKEAISDFSSIKDAFEATFPIFSQEEWDCLFRDFIRFLKKEKGLSLFKDPDLALKDIKKPVFQETARTGDADRNARELYKKLWGEYPKKKYFNVLKGEADTLEELNSHIITPK